MGGTTAKVCLIEDGRPLVTHAFEVDRLYRLRRRLGAAGPGAGDRHDRDRRGRRLDRRASTRSGWSPSGRDSAGSEPGPVCYGRGGTPCTVTDADLVLGYLDPDSFLGGPDDRWTSGPPREAIRTQVAEPMGIDVEQAAWGVHATVNENMANAARVHAIERGQDVTRLPLFVLGRQRPAARARAGAGARLAVGAGAAGRRGAQRAGLPVGAAAHRPGAVGPHPSWRPRGADTRPTRRLEQLRTEADEGADRVRRARRGDRAHEHPATCGSSARAPRPTVAVPAGGRRLGRARCEAGFRRGVRGAVRHRRPARRRGRDPHLAGELPRPPTRRRGCGFAPPRREATRWPGRRRAWFPEPTGTSSRGVHDRCLLRARRRSLEGPALVRGARVDAGAAARGAAARSAKTAACSSTSRRRAER